MSDENEVQRKARERGDLMFTVVSQDQTMPETICDWITRNIRTAPEEKLHDALAIAIAARHVANPKAAD